MKRTTDKPMLDTSEAPSAATASTATASAATVGTLDTDAPRPLRDSAREAIDHFLTGLDGGATTELFDMVMAQVEEPLLAAVMAYTAGNQSKASEMLGLNRGTLRKKLRQYGLVEQAPEPPLHKRRHRN